MRFRQIPAILAILTGSAWASDIHRSAATSDNSGSIYANPAGLSVARGPNMVAFFEGDSAGNIGAWQWASSLGHWAFGIGADEIDRHYFIGNGKQVSRFVSLGFVFKHQNSRSAFDLGIQARPFGFLSVGGRSYNLIRENAATQSRLAVSAIALKPLNFLTIALDQVWADNGLESQILSGELKLGRNLYFYTDYDPDSEKFSVGLSCYLNRLGAGFADHTDGNARENSVAAISYSYDARPVAKLRPGKRVAEIEIDGLIRDSDPEFSLFGQIWTPSRSITNQIRKAASNPSIRGIIIKIGQISCGLATIEEIRNAILEAQLAGKKVVCHLDEVEMGEYYLACAATEVAVTPTAHWFTPGFGFEVPLYKGLLEKLGVEPEFVVAGKYKGFAEPFTADSLSAEFRENEMRVMSNWFERMIDRIAISRDLPPTYVDSLIRCASFTPQRAKELELIDRMAYYSDLATDVWGKKTKKIGMKKISLYKEDWRSEKKIAVIILSGSIVLGNSFTDIFSGSQLVGSNSVTEMLRKAVKNDLVGAIVIRLQSGGGSALASDIIWHEVKKARKKKPVIISIGDVAASGAYYIACAGDTIVADPGSVVGSIGVYGGKIVLKGLYEKIGYKTETIKIGNKADAFSPSRGFSKEEKEMLRKEIRRTYQTFKQRVAEGRKMDSVAIDSVSEGRIFTGSQAKENGLIDVLGDLGEAIGIAKQKAGIKTDEVQLDIYPKAPSLWAGLGNERTKNADLKRLQKVLSLNKTKIWAVAPWCVKR